MSSEPSIAEPSASGTEDAVWSEPRERIAADDPASRLELKRMAGNVQQYIKLPFLYEHWYVAGLSGEFSRTLTSKILLDRSIVFFRKEDGVLVALQNRCAHRSFPLSDGVLEGDVLTCRYHGIRYGCDGRFLSVPSQTRVPRGGVKRYAVVETGPFVWIWMGEGEGDPAAIPDMSAYRSPNWTFCVGTLPMEGNYLLMLENLADLSHLPFLHAKTFGVTEAIAAQPITLEVDRDDLSVRFYRESDSWSAMRPFFPAYFDYEGRPVHSINGGGVRMPGSFRGMTRLDVLDAAPGEQSVLNIYFDHFLTPESYANTHYYYAVARDSAIDDTHYTELTARLMAVAFAEDAVAVKRMQLLLDTDRHHFREICVPADQPAMAVRNLILSLYRREYTG